MNNVDFTFHTKVDENKMSLKVKQFGKLSQFIIYEQIYQIIFVNPTAYFLENKEWEHNIWSFNIYFNHAH